MRTLAFLCCSLVGASVSALGFPQLAPAQVPPPPGPAAPLPPPPPPAPQAKPTPPAPAPATPAPSPPSSSASPAATAPPPAPARAAPATDPATAPAGAPPSALSAAASTVDAATLEREQAARRASLYEHTTLQGSSGMLRIARAGSGRRGSFRFGISGNYFSASGFLCPPCVDPNGGAGNVEDDATRVGANVMLSTTPLDTVEAYLAIHSHSTSNNLGLPRLLQVVGDTTIGAKVFSPSSEDEIWSGGGALDFTFLNGTGSVGLSTANVAVHALGTVDLNNRSDPSERAPWRFHGNLSYVFDNSSNLIEDTETARNQRVSRIERFGLGINRADKLQFGFGAEALWRVLRPFAEYSLDVPVNRQGYTCLRNLAYVGDSCLDDNSSFSSIPSRLTLGLRGHLQALPGLALLGALDVAVTGSSEFLDETAPEAPYTLHFGLSYAADPTPETKVMQVEVERPPPLRGTRITGIVVEAGTNKVIPGALVTFEGRDWTGMITTSQGRFETPELGLGTYSFRVAATDYRDGSCSISLPVTPSTTTAPSAPTQPTTPAAFGSRPSSPTAPQLRCEMFPLPRIGNIEGNVIDAKTNLPILGAKVKVVDKLNRQLDLVTDARGAFRFERVPEGSARVIASADKYLSSAAEWQIEMGKDTPAMIALNLRPRPAGVVLGAKEVTIRQPIVFEEGSRAIAPASMVTVEELADLLQAHPELLLIEIQVHSFAGSDEALSLNISKERANALRETLIRIGVDGARVRANGFVGPGAPKGPAAAPTAAPAKKPVLRPAKVRVLIEQRKAPEAPKTLPAPPPTPPTPSPALPTPPLPPAPRPELPQ